MKQHIVMIKTLGQIKSNTIAHSILIIGRGAASWLKIVIVVEAV